MFCHNILRLGFQRQHKRPQPVFVPKALTQCILRVQSLGLGQIVCHVHILRGAGQAAWQPFLISHRFLHNLLCHTMLAKQASHQCSSSGEHACDLNPAP